MKYPIVCLLTFIMCLTNLMGENINVFYKNGTIQQETTNSIDSINFGDTDAKVISLSSSSTSTTAAEKQIRILFVGNSLTQDAVSYVPLLLKEMAPDLDFKLYIFYSGGKTLDNFYNDYFLPKKPCSIFSVCENITSWKNNSNNTTIDQVLSKYEFDILCLQEYFNYKTSYPDSDLENFNKCLGYIQDNYKKPFEVVTFLHQPKRTVINTVFPLTLNGVKLILEKTSATSVIPAGYAIVKAMATELDDLGDVKHLSPDNTHAQEGLPCLLQAYVVAGWILEKLGMPANINNCTTRVTPENYKSIKIPGMNLGSGVITGNEQQNRIAQKIAIQALKAGKGIENSVFNSMY